MKQREKVLYVGIIFECSRLFPFTLWDHKSCFVWKASKLEVELKLLTWKSLKWLPIHKMIVNCTIFYWKLMEVWNIKGILNSSIIEQIFTMIFIPVSWVWLAGRESWVEDLCVNSTFIIHTKTKPLGELENMKKNKTTLYKKRTYNRTYTVYFIPTNTLRKWRIKQGTGGTSHLTIQ